MLFYVYMFMLNTVEYQLLQCMSSSSSTVILNNSVNALLFRIETPLSFMYMFMLKMFVPNLISLSKRMVHVSMLYLD